MPGESDKKGGLDGSDDPEDSQDQVVDVEPAPELDDDEIDETLNNNREQRDDFNNQVSATSEELADDIETGSETEARSLGGLVKEALGIGKEMKDKQDAIEEGANTFRSLHANRKAMFETEFQDREDRVSIDGDSVEEEYGNFRDEFDLALSETLPMSWERSSLQRIKRNNSRFEAATGQIDSAEERAIEEAGDLWLYGEAEAEDAKDRASDAIGTLLDEVNVEGQAMELKDRKEKYDEFKDIVDTAIETVQEADSEVSLTDVSEAIQEASEEYDLDIDADLDDEVVESVAERGRNYIDDVAEDLGVEGQVVSSVTTDITEFFEDGEVDPIEAARLLKTTAADALARQEERYQTAVDTVMEVRGDLQETLDSYDTFTTKAEDLTKVSGVGEQTAEYLADAEIDNVFDLANASQRRLDRMTDVGTTHGENAAELVNSAQSYIETELAQELGLESLEEQMEETLPVGEETSIQYAIREQAEAAYNAVDTVERHVNGLLENDLPAEEELGVEFEVDGETYTSAEVVDQARSEAYGEMGRDPVALDNIDFLEEPQDLDLDY